MKKLLLGTGNKTKIDFYRRFLKDLQYELVSAADLDIPEPEETGETLDDNARLKARHYCERSGLPAIADDAGFEIPALGNFPGVHSNRFSGASRMTEEEIISGILERMKGLKGSDRAARMRIVCALAFSPDDIRTATGSISGHVPESSYEKKRPLFPYRSLLFVDELNKWFEDVTEDEEERLGYRKGAVCELKKYLQ